MPTVFVSCLVVVLTLAGSAHAAAGAGPRVLVVTPVGENAAAIEVGLRDGAGSVPGAAVADAATAATLVEDARSTGLDCVPDDGSCWLRVAVLGGLDHIVYASGATVSQVSSSGTSTTPVIDGRWAPAVRRAFGLESAVRLTLAPTSAVATIDGQPFDNGIAEGVTPGTHTVSATAPGFAPASTTVDVPAGALAEVALSLQPEVVAAAPDGWSTALRYGGGGTALVGVGVGSALISVGQLSCDNEDASTRCGPDENNPTDTFADQITLAGIGVIVGVGGVGLAALAGSFLLGGP